MKIDSIYIKFVKFVKLVFVFLFLFYTTNLLALENKIIIKVNNEIITSIDIENESKYLMLLNPQVKNLDKKRLMNIAKKVANNMSSDVQKSGLSPMEIWKATSSLAKSTVKSDALDIVDGIITQNITESMNPGMSNVNDLQNQIKLMNINDDSDDSDNENN